MGKFLGLVVVLVVLGGAFLIFGKGGQKAEAPVVPKPTAQVGTSAAPVGMPAGETKEVVVKASSWAFDPAEIRVKEGTKVKVTLQGVSGTHAFAIPELGVNSKTVSAGETTMVEFVASKKGEFSFKCSVFCGEGHSGMTGKLIVE